MEIIYEPDSTKRANMIEALAFSRGFRSLGAVSVEPPVPKSSTVLPVIVSVAIVCDVPLRSIVAPLFRVTFAQLVVWLLAAKVTLPPLTVRELETANPAVLSSSSVPLLTVMPLMKSFEVPLNVVVPVPFCVRLVALMLALIVVALELVTLTAPALTWAPEYTVVAPVPPSVRVPEPRLIVLVVVTAPVPETVRLPALTELPLSAVVPELAKRYYRVRAGVDAAAERERCAVGDRDIAAAVDVTADGNAAAAAKGNAAGIECADNGRIAAAADSHLSGSGALRKDRRARTGDIQRAADTHAPGQVVVLLLLTVSDEAPLSAALSVTAP